MVIEPSLQLVCSRAQEVVPVAPTPIEVEAYDSDHETSDQVTTILPLNFSRQTFPRERTRFKKQSLLLSDLN